MTDVTGVTGLALGGKRPLESADDARPKEARLDDGLQQMWEQAQAVQENLLQMDHDMTREFQRIEHETTVRKEPLYARRGELLRNVDSFWSTALANSEIADYMSELDKGLLHYLESLDVTTPDENGSYSIELEFSQDNPIFATPVLRRTLQKNLATGSIDASCNDLVWRRDLRTEVDGEGRPLLEQYTFLSWFLGQGEIQEDDGDVIAEEIRTAIWPNPLHWFYGGDEDLDLELQQDGINANAAELDDADDGDAAIAAFASAADGGVADDDDNAYSDEEDADDGDPGTPPEEGDEEEDEEEDADGDEDAL